MNFKIMSRRNLAWTFYEKHKSPHAFQSFSMLTLKDMSANENYSHSVIEFNYFIELSIL